ncbi:MAG: hypothetical protein ABI867_36880 [Kofleriaceae bacterium]
MIKIAPAILALCATLSGCALDDDELDVGQTESEVQGSNRLAANRLAANSLNASKLSTVKLASTSLANNALLATVEGRDVFSFIVGCALSTGTTLSVTYSGTAYTFPGWLGLAPQWATRVPTTAEKHWVSACVLARTNLTGTMVDISMRHDTYAPLASTAAERSTFGKIEGAFYGDLFAATPMRYACANRSWTAADGTATSRHCAFSTTGTVGSTTQCGFTYTGLCAGSSPPCNDKNNPYGDCAGGSTRYAEVITIYLK